MRDILGMDQIGKSEGASTVCTKSASVTEMSTGWACDRTDCSSYGKWWCPFTGW